MSQTRAREHGFALVIVLWTMGLMALLVTGLVVSGRTEIALAVSERASAAAEAAADGAVQRAIYQLLGDTWQADGTTRRIVLGRSIVAVTIEDQSGLINPNFASPALLAALLGAASVPPAQSMAIARRIVDWRTATPYSIEGGLKLDRYRQAGLPYGPPDRPFASVDEIGQVPGVTADLLARLRPYLSVFQTGDPRIAEGAAPGRTVVSEAEMINRASVLVGFNSPDKTVRIEAVATTPMGSRFVRTAVVRFPARPDPGERAWRIVTWGE